MKFMIDAYVRRANDELMVALNADTFEESRDAIRRAAATLREMRARVRAHCVPEDEVVGVAV